MKLSREDFEYVMRRIGKDPKSPTGEALSMMMVGGSIMVEAVRRTGVPVVRLNPSYEQAACVAASMYLTQDEIDSVAPGVSVNQAAAILKKSREKENPFTPKDADYEVIALLKKSPPEGLRKSMGAGPDEMPGVAADTLWALHKAGAVSQSHEGDGVFRWRVTPAGLDLLASRYRGSAVAV